jgi:hypothetical protein
VKVAPHPAVPANAYAGGSMSVDRRTGWLVLGGVVLALTTGGVAHAQRLSLSPQIGLYVPTKAMYDATSTADIYKLEAGFSFGARVGLWFGKRIGIDLSGNYVPTTFRLDSAGTSLSSQNARLFTGAGQVVLFLIPASSPLSLYVNGGVGVVSHGGVAFTSEASTTDISGVFGGGAAIRLGPIGVHVGADLFTYTGQYQGTTATAQELRQLDIQLHLALGVPFGG